MPRKKKGSELARSKPIMSGVKEAPKKKVVNTGKKKLKSDLVFKEEELQDSADAASDDALSDDSGPDDGESEDDDYEVDEDVEEGEASEEAPEPTTEGYQDLLIKLLQEKVGNGKRKRGAVEKHTGKRAKLKVGKTNGEEVKHKGVVVKTQ